MNCGIKGLLFAIASLSTTFVQAGIFELRGHVVADVISDECAEFSGPNCFAGLQAVGDRGVLRFFVDVGTRITDHDAYDALAGVHPSYEPDQQFGEWQVNGVDAAFQGSPFAGTNYEPLLLGGTTLLAFAGINFSLGSTHGLSITAISQDNLDGTATISLSDSSGTAFAGLDLFTDAAVDNWLVNHFSLTLFDSGTWWVETFDGGGGASGRFTVPGPPSVALLGIGLLLVGLAGRRRPRGEKRQRQA